MFMVCLAFLLTHLSGVFVTWKFFFALFFWCLFNFLWFFLLLSRFPVVSAHFAHFIYFSNSLCFLLFLVFSVSSIFISLFSLFSPVSFQFFPILISLASIALAYVFPHTILMDSKILMGFPSKNRFSKKK